MEHYQTAEVRYGADLTKPLMATTDSNVIVADYDGFEMFFMNDGWIDATNAVKKFEKRLDHWLESQDTKDYMSALSKSLGFNSPDFGELKITKRGRYGSGTWLHPKLAVRFSQWLNAYFAVWCDEQIERILRGGVAQTIALPRAQNTLEALREQNRIVRQHGDMLDAILSDAIESRAERERQKIEQQRLAVEIKEVRSEIADIRQYQQNVAALIATPVPQKPGGCEAMTTLKSKFYKRHGLSGWVVDRVLTQLEGFRVVPKAYVQNGVRHEADGVTVVVDSRGNTIDAPGYLVYQAATCTSVMNEFIRDCVRVSPCKVTHPALPGKPFNLNAGLARGEK